MPVYTQCEHARINTREYPGTRQLCYECDKPTGRCEEDSISGIDGRDYCEECYAAYPDKFEQED